MTINLEKFKSDWLAELRDWPEERHAGSFVGWYDQRKKACWSAFGLACWAADLHPYRGAHNGYFFVYRGQHIHSPREDSAQLFINDFDLRQPVKKLDLLDLGWQDMKIVQNLITNCRGYSSETIPLIEAIDFLEMNRCTLLTIHKLIWDHYDDLHLSNNTTSEA